MQLEPLDMLVPGNLSSPQSLASFLAVEQARLAVVIRGAGITLE